MAAEPDRPPADEVPVFALQTVLFPGGPLALRVFEARYLDMVSGCVRDRRPFGVCLIREGAEVGAPARVHAVGTLAWIVDWHHYEDGLLGIVALGETRFRATGFRVAPDGLLLARAGLLPEEPPVDVPPELAPLGELAGALVERAGALYEHAPRTPRDASWVGRRLAELLPWEPALRQAWLEDTDAVARLSAQHAGLAARARERDEG